MLRFFKLAFSRPKESYIADNGVKYYLKNSSSCKPTDAGIHFPVGFLRKAPETPSDRCSVPWQPSEFYDPQRTLFELNGVKAFFNKIIFQVQTALEVFGVALEQLADAEQS